MKPIDLSRLESLQIDTVLAGATLDAQRPRFAKLAQRHENGTAPRAVSAFNLFQTPPEVARRLVDSLDLKSGARVLEPSAGARTYFGRAARSRFRGRRGRDRRSVCR